MIPKHLTQDPIVGLASFVALEHYQRTPMASGKCCQELQPIFASGVVVTRRYHDAALTTAEAWAPFRQIALLGWQCRSVWAVETGR